MMKKTVIATTNAPGAIGPYSQGMIVGDLVFTSGQIPINPADGTIPATIEEQAAQSLENVKAILEAAGTTLDQAVKVTVFLTDMNHFAAVNEVYAKYFSTDFPCRSAVQVGRLPKDVLIEIEAIAVK